jgi:CelD/BcsL family acetyltransferase involved in cellulose biosynthesis
MLVQRLSTFAELSQLADQWNCLARGVPFRSWQWLFNWWGCYGGDYELFVLSVRDDAGQLVGAAPLCLSHTAARGRVLRFLGSGEVCSERLTLLATPEHEEAVAAAAAQWLVEASKARRDSDRWDLLELTAVDSQDLAVQALAKHFEQEGCRVHRREGLPCWRVDLPASWEEYLAAFSNSSRWQLRRLQRRAFDRGRAVVQTVRRAEELERGMDILVDLHQRRWRSLGQPGCFASPRFSRFLHEAAQALLEAGQLRLHWIELEGRPAAAAFHFAGGGAVYSYQGGIHPAMLNQSPGSLLHLATIQEAIRERQHTYDFLRGDEPYKMRWKAQPRPTVELRVAARRVGPQLRHGVWRAGDAVKTWIKSSLRPPAAVESTKNDRNPVMKNTPV